MQSLKNRIEDLIGATANHANIDDLALKDFLEASTKEIVDKLPNEVLLPYGDKETTSSHSVSVIDKRVLRVTKSGVIATPKDVSLTANVTQSGSIHKAEDVSPVYIINDEFALAVHPTSGTESKVYTYSYPTITITDTDIGGSAGKFPTTASYAVILCAAMKCMQSIINDLIHIEEDVELVQASQLELTSLQNLYQMEMQRFGV